jgi:predicted ribosome quality control (RQC) complex YloA/Tae2 family protein
MLTDRQLDDLHTQLKSILSQLLEAKFEPTIVLDEKGETIDITPIPLNRYKSLESRRHKTFNEALDEYFTQTTHATAVDSVRKEYERELAKLQRMLHEQQTNIDESKNVIEENRRIGDLLYAHLGELQLLKRLVLDEKQKDKSWEQITSGLEADKQLGRSPATYFDSVDSKRMVLNIAIENKIIQTRLNRSIQENASGYYDRMKKAQRRLEGSQKALQETLGKIQDLQKLWTERIEQVHETVPPKQARKAWYEKFRWFRSSDGFLVVAGRDAVTNEILIRKHLEPGDIVFHAEVKGAPFVVIKAEGRPCSEQTIQEAAQFAGCYSRAWREMFNAVDVYWVHHDQVSKTPPTGQYLEKGSFVIKGVKNYVRGVPLRMGIGVRVKDDDLGIVGGPAKMVLKQATFYMELGPGKQPSGVLARQIRGLLAEKAPKNLRQQILAMPNEQLQGFIPFSTGEITLK